MRYNTSWTDDIFRRLRTGPDTRRAGRVFSHVFLRVRAVFDHERAEPHRSPAARRGRGLPRAKRKKLGAEARQVPGGAHRPLSPSREGGRQANFSFFCQLAAERTSAPRAALVTASPFLSLHYVTSRKHGKKYKKYSIDYKILSSDGRCPPPTGRRHAPCQKARHDYMLKTGKKWVPRRSSTTPISGSRICP